LKKNNIELKLRFVKVVAEIVDIILRIESSTLKLLAFYEYS